MRNRLPKPINLFFNGGDDGAATVMFEVIMIVQKTFNSTRTWFQFF